MPSSEEVTTLAKRVQSLTESIALEKEAKRTSNRRTRWFIALLVLVAGWGWWNNNERIDQIITVRTGSRAVSCNDRHDFATAHNYLVFGLVTRNFTRPVPDDLAKGTLEQLVPVPDCSSPKAVEDMVTGKTTPTKPDFPTIPLTGIQPDITAGTTTPPVRADIDR